MLFPSLWAWRISPLTWSGTLDEETANTLAAQHGQVAEPFWRVAADHVVVPRAELVALYGDAPVDVPVIRRILGETK